MRKKLTTEEYHEIKMLKRAREKERRRLKRKEQRAENAAKREQMIKDGLSKYSLKTLMQ